MQKNEKHRLLVVDDDPQIIEVVEQALSGSGIEVLKAGSGEEALEVIKENKISVFLLDLQLPGMNGIELCRQINQENPVGIKLAMTGYVSVFHLVECREAGFDDYFVKPFKIEFLMDRLEMAFNKIERWKRGKGE